MSEPARSDSSSEAQSESQSSEPSGNLPAPYVSPWQEFGRNLQAMAADVRLRSQELWRRNQEGELSVPGFWPRDLAPSFWPLLLVLLLLLPLAGIRLWQDHSRPAPRPDPVELQRTSPLELPAPELIPAPQRKAEEPSPVQEAMDAEPAVEPSEPEQPNQPHLSFDPLFELFQDTSVPEGLLRSAKPVPEQDRLLLELSVGVWQQLPPDQRQTLASSWLQSAFELDYASLQLVNEQGDLLGRSARVGGGMILFDLGLVG
ncbi:hypothetical protein [Synechococcus sp. RS9902]|uniref:hypothetical protein n=1 Tax=Synechococcus sp. RS9902 TaxID=221345 RepID=UPI0018613C9C|nr:hypothetical protein [Synechococcus sp. RS9902]QNI97761.1 putative conserved membrane protein [Synechococcus sp. RS9902]